MTYEKALFVVVGVDKPAGDLVGVARSNFAGLGMEDIDSVDFDLNFAVVSIEDIDVGFSEDDEEVAGAGVFEFVGHVEIGVHPGFEDGEATEFAKFGGLGVVVEGAGDDDIKSSISGFSGGRDEIGA